MTEPTITAPSHIRGIQAGEYYIVLRPKQAKDRPLMAVSQRSFD